MIGPVPTRGPRAIIAGPWPFITFHSFEHRGRRIIWRARQHRKGLAPEERAEPALGKPFWRTPGYNWWMGLIFAVGSLLFLLGSVLSLLPSGSGVPSTLVINLVFFAGSIPFTTAGFLQNFQAANAAGGPYDVPGETRHRRIALIGWRPRSIGWISTITQFVGTIAFNFNTFDAIHSPSGWYAQDLVIWLPGMIGSVLFLVSGYLGFMETSHGYWSWKPRDLDWQIVFSNLLGCVFFMTASLLAFVPKGPEPGWIDAAANVHLGLGAIGFFVGSALMMRESVAARHGAAVAATL